VEKRAQARGEGIKTHRVKARASSEVPLRHENVRRFFSAQVRSPGAKRVFGSLAFPRSPSPLRFRNSLTKVPGPPKERREKEAVARETKKRSRRGEIEGLA